MGAMLGAAGGWGREGCESYLMRFLADISGVPIVRAVHAEVTAWGAASLAARTSWLTGCFSGRQRALYATGPGA